MIEGKATANGYICPVCGKPGLPSVRGDYCTACANIDLFGLVNGRTIVYIDTNFRAYTHDPLKFKIQAGPR